MTGQQDSQTALEALERANLFVISLDEERRWYRYHHLFAEVLRNRLQQRHRDLITVLHRRASLWYEQQGLFVEAVKHALAAQDVEHAASLLEQWGIMLAHRGQIHLVLDWLNSLPHPVVNTRPKLCILHAAMLMFIDHFEEALTYLNHVEQSLQDDSTSREAQIIRGQMAVLRRNIALFTGDLANAVILMREALALLPESEKIWRMSANIQAVTSYLVDGNVTPAVQRIVEHVLISVRASSGLFSMLGITFLLAWLYIMQGKLHQAIATFEQVMQEVPEQAELRRGLGGPAYSLCMGELLREWNDLDAAERHVRDGLDRLHWADTITQGYISLARIHRARGHYQEARATLDAFEQVAQQHQFIPRLFRLGAAIRAEVALAQSDLTSAIIWADGCTLSTNDDLSYLYEREYLTLARVRIAQGRAHSSSHFLQDTLAFLERLLVDAQAKARMHSAIEILVLKALALDVHGDRPAALDMLTQALSLAAPEGYVRLFLDEGAPMLTLLSQVSKTEPLLHGYVQQLLAQAHVVPASSLDHQPSQKQPLVEPLSERELEVLHLMAGGASNEEIAEQLVIATGTAKRHVSNILAKLAVSNRTQAVARARELHLL